MICLFLIVFKFVFKENSYGWTVIVIELSCSGSPEKRTQKKEGDEQTND